MLVENEALPLKPYLIHPFPGQQLDSLERIKSVQPSSFKSAPSHWKLIHHLHMLNKHLCELHIYQVKRPLIPLELYEIELQLYIGLLLLSTKQYGNNND